MTRIRFLAASIIICFFRETLESASLTRLSEEAEVIVVARPLRLKRVDGTSLLTLQPVRIIKGRAAIGKMESIHVGQIDVNSNEGCGLWFLRSIEGKLSAVKLSQAPGPDSIRLLLGSCNPTASFAYSQADSIADKLLMELAESVEIKNGTQPNLVEFFMMMKGSKSKAESRSIARFANSPNLELRVISRGLRIRLGDADALREAESDLVIPLSSQAKQIYLMSITDFSHPAGVETLGRISAVGSQSDLVFQRAAACALKKIHNRSSLVHLYRMLDHKDKQIRECAVSGFSLFRLGVRSGLTGDEFGRELSSAASPSGNFKSEEERAGLHLGPFVSDSEEEFYVNFYRSWWLANSGQ